MIVRMPDGSVAVMARGARAGFYRPGGGICARGVIRGGWGALGRGDGMVRCQGRGLPAPPRVGLKPVVADQMTISRRKTIRAVIMRTIIDGTTDMRGVPPVGCCKPATGLTKAFAEPVAAWVLHLQCGNKAGLVAPDMIVSAIRQNFVKVSPDALMNG